MICPCTDVDKSADRIVDYNLLIVCFVLVLMLIRVLIGLLIGTVARRSVVV